MKMQYAPTASSMEFYFKWRGIECCPTKKGFKVQFSACFPDEPIPVGYETNSRKIDIVSKDKVVKVHCGEKHGKLKYLNEESSRGIRDTIGTMFVEVGNDLIGGAS